MRAPLIHLTYLTSLSLRFAPLCLPQDHVLQGVHLPHLERFRYAAYTIEQSLLASFLRSHGNTLLGVALDADIWIVTRNKDQSFQAFEPEPTEIQLPFLRVWIGPLLLALSIRRSTVTPLETVIFTRCVLSGPFPVSSGRLGDQINSVLASIGSPDYLLIVHNYSTTAIVDTLDKRLLLDLRKLYLRYQPYICGRRLEVGDFIFLIERLA